MNRENSSKPNNLDDLQWLAFCYVSDELDDEERVRFEAKLADQQEARDAVAEAIKQNNLMYAAFLSPGQVQTDPEPTSRSNAKPTRGGGMPWRLPASLLAAAAGLMLIAYVFNPLNSSSQPIADTDAELAEAWASTLVSLDQEEVEELVTEELNEVTFGEEDSWLFAAIDQVEEDGSMPIDPMEMDEDDDLPRLQ